MYVRRYVLSLIYELCRNTDLQTNTIKAKIQKVKNCLTYAEIVSYRYYNEDFFHLLRIIFTAINTYADSCIFVIFYFRGSSSFTTHFSIANFSNLGTFYRFMFLFQIRGGVASIYGGMIVRG